MKSQYRHAQWAVLAALCFSASAFAQSAADPVVKASGTAPVVTLTRVHGMVESIADRPLVRLYADGFVAIHVPAYMKAAGYYEFELEDAEFGALMRDFDAAGLTRFDASAVRTRQAAAAQSRQAATGVRYITTDSTTTRIDLNFARFSGAGETVAAVSQRIEWDDLAIAAERYPQLAELAGLASVEQRLLELVGDSRRRPVKAPTRQ